MTGFGPFIYRPMTGADIQAVKALHALSFEMLAAALHSPAQIQAHQALIADPAYEQDLWQSHLTLAIDAGGTIAGTAGWIEMPEEPGTARIRKVFIHPDRARQGLGSRLVIDAEDRARDTGRTRFFVRANLNAVLLYQKLGYRLLREGVMEAPGGVELPVRYMEKV